jgi:thymidylate kinase
MVFAAVSTSQPLLEQAFDALNARGVRWSLLRDPSAGDVDMLVAAGDLPYAHAALQALGFARLPAWGRGGHRFYIAYQAATDSWTRLDLDSAIAYGAREELPTDAEAACLARVVPNANVRTLHPSDAYWTLLLHCLLDKHAFKAGYRARLQELADIAETRGALPAIIAAHAPAGWSPECYVAATRAGEWHKMLATAAELERRWRRAAGWRARRALLVNGALQRSTKVLNLARRRGLGVALLGPDGAGKSTLAFGVRDSFIFPTRLVYMGLYQRQEQRSRLPGLGFASRLLTQWRRYAVASYHRARGRLVIYDRYAYDQLASGPDANRSRKSRARRWLLFRAAPAPQLALVLNAPGDVLFARKGEHDAARLDAQRAQFADLAARRREVELLDATRDADAVRRDALERIWRAYVSRWR